MIFFKPTHAPLFPDVGTLLSTSFPLKHTKHCPFLNSGISNLVDLPSIISAHFVYV